MVYAQNKIMTKLWKGFTKSAIVYGICTILTLCTKSIPNTVHTGDLGSLGELLLILKLAIPVICKCIQTVCIWYVATAILSLQLLKILKGTLLSKLIFSIIGICVAFTGIGLTTDKDLLMTTPTTYHLILLINILTIVHIVYKELKHFHHGVIGLIILIASCVITIKYIALDVVILLAGLLGQFMAGALKPILQQIIESVIS